MAVTSGLWVPSFFAMVIVWTKTTIQTSTMTGWS